MFADSHCHLDFPNFAADREQVFARAWDGGVRHLLAIGSGAGTQRLRAGLDMAEGRDWVWATVGIHPHDASAVTDAHFDELTALASNPRVVALGELGLDYHYDNSPRDIQRQVFLRQLDLAEQFRLPIVIHCRDAWDDCMRIIEDRWKRTSLGGILHCFSGTLDDARRGLDCGFYISFAGNITFPKAGNLREVAIQILRDRLLIETDSPFLSPVPNRGKRNEPANVRLVAQQIAALQGLASEQVGEFTTNNFLQFVKKSR